MSDETKSPSWGNAMVALFAPSTHLLDQASYDRFCQVLRMDKEAQQIIRGKTDAELLRSRATWASRDRQPPWDFIFNIH